MLKHLFFSGAICAIWAFHGVAFAAPGAHDNAHKNGQGTHSNTPSLSSDAADPGIDNLGDWLTRGHLFGKAKAITFIQPYTGVPDNKMTTSFGGSLHWISPSVYGFSIGLAGYTAQDLGLNGERGEEIATVPYNSFTILGKAYLKYEGHGFMLKGGRIGIHTPFAAMNKGRRMVPTLYEGVGGSFEIPGVKGLKLTAYRIFTFKPYDSDEFVEGDTGRPTIPFAGFPSIESDGFYTAGLTYTPDRATKANLWYYNFDNRLQLAYAGVEVPVPALNVGPIKPYVGVNYIKEWETSDSQYAGEIDTDVFGAKIGFVVPRSHWKLELAVTHIPEHEDAYRNGGFISPYQVDGYNQSPVYVGQPLKSFATVSRPGTGYALRYVYFGDKLTLVGGLTRFELDPGSDGPRATDSTVNAGFVVFEYALTDRLSFEYLGALAAPDPAGYTGTIGTHRFYLTYTFGDTPDGGHGH